MNSDITFTATRAYAGAFTSSGLTTVNFVGTKEQAEALFTNAKTGLKKNKTITINYGYGTEAAGTETWTIA